jgi:hypothetical protein
MVETVGRTELHRVVDRQARRHDAARRIDVHGDLFLGVVRLKEKQLRHDQRSRTVVDRPDHEDDALAQQAREDVEGTLASRRLLDDHRHEVIGVVADGIAHGVLRACGIRSAVADANIGAPAH